MANEPIDHLGSLIGASRAMQSIFDRIRKAAASDVTVLLTGESGTGKELAAREIHRLSQRAKGMFVPVNAGAIPRDLTASELFGHEAGAFTGAAARRMGKFEVADGGTLFLDEIAATDGATQIALLRALEERAISRLGGDRPIPVDVRFLAATNESLTRAIRDGRFREDLYYRLDIFQIRLPPLRDRDDDVRLLAAGFLVDCAKEAGREMRGISGEAMACLTNYSWPGNVRELRNCIQRAVVASDGDEIQRGDLPKRLQKVSHVTKEVTFKLRRRLGDVEKAYVLQTLSDCGGNKMEASRLLGISRKTLYEKLARWKRDEEEETGDVFSLGDEETIPIEQPRSLEDE
ncbi:MAG: sigma-54 dependent transcriptional regulator [Planctomycetota bacterium]